MELLSHQERLYTVLEVRDRGTGIPPTDIKHIFEPFYSGKNTNFNWGMGLYHGAHYRAQPFRLHPCGESAGGGVSFLILLPRYSARLSGQEGGTRPS